jgi:small subunit ribosomal protein S8
MVTDPIADLLIQVKNGYLAGKKIISVPHSSLKARLASVLEKEGYVKKAQNSSPKTRNDRKEILITLKYASGKPAMEHVKRVSKPGVRIYVDRSHIPTVLTGHGIAILSTSKGLLTDTEARKQKVGGEVLCHVW